MNSRAKEWNLQALCSSDFEGGVRGPPRARRSRARSRRAVACVPRQLHRSVASDYRALNETASDMALRGRAALAAMLVHVWFGRSRAASLSEALGKATFYNNGTAHASDGALV